MAFAEQARADYRAYVVTGEAASQLLADPHRLHLLQMALEKMAKAFLYHADPHAPYSHQVLAPALNHIRHPTVAEAVGMRLRPFARLLEVARPILLQVEAAGPSVGPDGHRLTREESERSANVEYPWQRDVADPASWVVPAGHVFPIMRAIGRAPGKVPGGGGAHPMIWAGRLGRGANPA